MKGYIRTKEVEEREKMLKKRGIMRKKPFYGDILDSNTNNEKLLHNKGQKESSEGDKETD